MIKQILTSISDGVSSIDKTPAVKAHITNEISRLETAIAVALDSEFEQGLFDGMTNTMRREVCIALIPILKKHNSAPLPKSSGKKKPAKKTAAKRKR